MVVAKNMIDTMGHVISVQEVLRVLPNSLKGWAVCYHAYMIGAHKNVWIIRTCLITILLSSMSECVCVAALMVIAKRGSVPFVACGPVF